MKKIITFFLALPAMLVSHAQETKIIKLKQHELTARPIHYFIDSVRDDRPDTTTIGSVRSGIFSKKMVSLNLPGGAASAIHEFLSAELRQDVTKDSFSIHITQLEVGEKTGGLKAESEVRMTIAFFTHGRKVTDYKGSNTIQAGMDATRYIEELIRTGLDNMLQQFDTWYAANGEAVRASLRNPSIRVDVQLKDDTGDTDRIGFSFHRMLVLDDFLGHPDDLSRASAITFSGIDIKFTSQTQYNEMQVLVTLTPFFDRTRSWCRTASRIPRVLRHEQKHFDITALKACELYTAIKSFTFTREKFTAELQQLYRKTEKETSEMQDKYDQETNHGQLTTIQDSWEKLIRDRLDQQTCYHP